MLIEDIRVVLPSDVEASLYSIRDKLPCFAAFVYSVGVINILWASYDAQIADYKTENNLIRRVIVCDFRLEISKIN